MFVYILNCHGQPLMPCQPRKARLLLKEGKAKVVKMVPFTLQLLYGSSGYKQEVSLGIDAGAQHIGVSATTEQRVLFELCHFDIWHIRHPELEGKAYQQGPQLGFGHVEEYVLARDRHECQWCQG